MVNAYFESRNKNNKNLCLYVCYYAKYSEKVDCLNILIILLIFYRALKIYQPFFEIVISLNVTGCFLSILKYFLLNFM